MGTPFSSQSNPPVKPPSSGISSLGGIALIVIPFLIFMAFYAGLLDP